MQRFSSTTSMGYEFIGHTSCTYGGGGASYPNKRVLLYLTKNTLFLEL